MTFYKVKCNNQSYKVWFSSILRKVLTWNSKAASFIVESNSHSHLKPNCVVKLFRICVFCKCNCIFLCHNCFPFPAISVVYCCNKPNRLILRLCLVQQKESMPVFWQHRESKNRNAVIMSGVIYIPWLWIYQAF